MARIPLGLFLEGAKFNPDAAIRYDRPRDFYAFSDFLSRLSTRLFDFPYKTPIDRSVAIFCSFFPFPLRTDTMPAPLRIAVLECDTPLPKIHDRYNGYGGVFTELLKASAKALNKPDQLDPETGLDISKWDVVNADNYPKLEDIDAVLLTGSSAWTSEFAL